MEEKDTGNFIFFLKNQFNENSSLRLNLYFLFLFSSIFNRKEKEFFISLKTFHECMLIYSMKNL